LPSRFHQNLGQPYLQLMRFRQGGEIPIGIQSSRILLAACPGLEAYDFARLSLYEVLLKKYKLSIHRIDHTISATIADEIQAGLLQISLGDPLLVVCSSAYLANEQLIEETVSYYRADKYKYHTSHMFRAKE
jgi:GntR family transcriptional regulator